MSTVQSPLSMSDEELMNVDPSTFLDSDNQVEVQEEEYEEVQQESVEQETQEVESNTEDPGEEVEQETIQETEQNAPSETNTSEVNTSTEEPVKTESVDYKAAYDKLTAPFKANGRDFSVNNVDDAIALMQMGVNYNKKMAGLKPHLKILKTLEKHNLLDEAKISYLIDLDSKKPEAINRLVKDSGIDPMDIDTDKADAYVPKQYTVDDKEIELDQVIEEIKDSPSFPRTVQLISNQLDAKSKQEISNYPQGIKILHSHIESGVFDVIMQEVDRERMLGRLQGLSDLEAYRQVGDAIQARNGFSHLGRQGQQTPSQRKVVQPNPKREDDSKLRDMRRAASPSKSAAPVATKPDFNPLALSDEEFSKLANSQFL